MAVQLINPMRDQFQSQSRTSNRQQLGFFLVVNRENLSADICEISPSDLASNRAKTYQCNPKTEIGCVGRHISDSVVQLLHDPRSSACPQLFHESTALVH